MMKTIKERLNKLCESFDSINKVRSVMNVKTITVEPIYTIKAKNKWGQERNMTLKVRKAYLDNEPVWYVIKGKKACVFVQEPRDGVVLSAFDFDERTFRDYERMERQHNRLKLKR